MLAFLTSFVTETAMASDLTIAFPKVEISGDPHAMETGYAMTMVLQLHRGLFRYRPDGELLPDLAENWTQSQDGKHYVFTLADAVFSDGTKLMPTHVVASFARLFDKSSSIGSDLQYIAGIREFLATKDITKLGVKVVGERQVAFDLARPSALFTKHLAAVDCAILPIADFHTPVAAPAPPGLGPYKVESWSADRIVLRRWRADRLDSRRPSERIIFLLTEKPTAELAAASQTDTLDREVLDKNAIDALTKKGWTRVPTEVAFERFLIMNPQSVPETTRQFLLTRVDQRRLAAAFPEASLRPAFGLIPFGLPGELPEDALHRHRKPEVKPTLGTIKLEYASGNPYDERVADLLVSMWAHPNLKVEKHPMPARDLLKLTFARAGSVTLRGRGLDYFDGYSVLAYFRGDFQDNYYHIKDSEIDRALDSVVTVADSEHRTREYAKVQHLILEHYTVVPLTFGSLASGLWSPATKSVPAHPGGIQTLPFEMIEMQ
jgi:ABC-type transport system substrate-binding protein